MAMIRWEPGGERKAQPEDRDEGYYRVERGSGAFSRSLTLSEGVNPDSVQAHFDRGVLEVRIPKPEQREPRKVAISVADSGSGPRTISGTETHASKGQDAGDPVSAGS